MNMRWKVTRASTAVVSFRTAHGMQCGISTAGLLSSNKDGVKCWSRDLKYKDAALLMRNSCRLWDAAMQDASDLHGGNVDKYLMLTRKRSKKFINNRSSVCNRENEFNALRRIINEPGSFAFLTGGSNCGKSLVLHNLKAYRGKEGHGLVLVANGRSSDRIEHAIREAIQQHPDEHLRQAASKAFHSLLSFIGSILSLHVPGGSHTSFEKLVYSFVQKPDSVELKQLLIGLASRYKPLTLVLDESNVFFGQDEHSSKTLRLLTTLTKEERGMSVIMSSSEFSFPLTLKEIGFNCSNLKPHIVMGDVPPACMEKLLKEEWGLGPHLTNALLDYLGGHILKISEAVSGLANEKRIYNPSEAFAPIENVQLDRLLKEGEELDIKKYLRILAEEGFVAMTSEDKAGHLLAKYNVAGYVSAEAKLLSLPSEYRMREGKVIKGFIPSSQSQRMLIAARLDELDGTKHE